MTEQPVGITLPILFNKVVVPGGDIPAGDYQLEDGHVLKCHANGTLTDLQKIGVATVTVQTEDTIKKLPEMALWGIAGGVIFGPVGLLIGLLAGGWGTQHCFLVTLKDNRKFLAVSNDKIMHKFDAMAGLSAT